MASSEMPELFTRFIKRKGQWLAMQVNVPKEQASRATEPSWGEEGSACVSNRVAVTALEEVERLRERVRCLESTPTRDEILLWEAYHQMKACDHYCAHSAAMRDVTAALDPPATPTDAGRG